MIMEIKALNSGYLSPELELIEAINTKVTCKSDEAPDFVEGWEIDFLIIDEQ